MSKVKEKVKAKRLSLKEGTSIFKSALKYSSEYKVYLIWSLIFMITSNVLELLIPIYILYK